MNRKKLSHLNADYRAYARLSASERIQWIRQDRWIHYSRAEQVLGRLSDLVAYPARCPHCSAPLRQRWPTSLPRWR
jgi:hypothetical protein